MPGFVLPGFSIGIKCSWGAGVNIVVKKYAGTITGMLLPSTRKDEIRFISYTFGAGVRFKGRGTSNEWFPLTRPRGRSRPSVSLPLRYEQKGPGWQ